MTQPSARELDEVFGGSIEHHRRLDRPIDGHEAAVISTASANRYRSVICFDPGNSLWLKTPASVSARIPSTNANGPLVYEKQFRPPVDTGHSDGLAHRAPVFAGETVATAIWIDGTAVSFRFRAKKRDLVVLDHGRCMVGFPNGVAWSGPPHGVQPAP